MVDVNRAREDGRWVNTGTIPVTEKGGRSVRWFILNRNERVMNDPQGRGLVFNDKEEANQYGRRYSRGAFAVCGMSQETWEEFKREEKPDSWVIVDSRGWRKEDQT